ncbi:MAG: C13 family peptidase [Candidatus Poribacteria bacterium]|nr:C13 family peptidase [Candidatus Poribacteria bacterium]MDP6996013.1 C13 family peptidase [Candidatus Poribacteria bacterium]
MAIRLTSPTDEVREYQANTDQEGRYQVKAPIQLDEVGNWQAQFSFAGNQKLAPSQRPWTIKVEKGVAEFSLLSPAKADLGDSYPLQLALDPKLADQAVTLKVLQPDGQVINLSATTGAESTLEQSFKLELPGNWTVTASWAGDDYYQPLTQTFEINVVKRYGKVVMALAGSNPSRESEWDKFHGIAQLVHQTFVSRRFDAKEDIYFLSTAPNQTANADGQTTLQNLQFAINTWAGDKVNANVPLYLYLSSHNLADKFVIQEDVFLTPTQLDMWLDELPPETPITIIIEACYSGNFIGSALSAPNRTIITSASADQQAMITRTSSFSRQQQIARNTTVAEAFEKSLNWTERTPLHRSQRPQLDANGNGNANEKQDYRALGQQEYQLISRVCHWRPNLSPH